MSSPFVFSTLILGAILIWTLDHTDIVAFVIVLVAGTALEAVLIVSVFKATPIPENDVTADAVSVNVGVRVAGYVIDLRDRDDGPLANVTIDGAGAVVVDTKPEAIAGIGTGAKPAE
jgi:hypothetical protein